jgi:hypothetical protein
MCHFSSGLSVGQIVHVNGVAMKILAGVGVGDKLLYAWPVDQEPPKGTNRIVINVNDIDGFIQPKRTSRRRTSKRRTR